MVVDKEVNPAFENYLFDWRHKFYVLVGGYGSSKSYHTALKLILKCFEEKRKVLVVREVYETIKESCYDLIYEILNEMDLLAESPRDSKRVQYRISPFSFTFPNGSKIIFKGMDKPIKLKSLNGVSIVWLEEAPEIKYAGFKEMLGRIRHPDLSLHFILTLNPVSKESWVYKHFFVDKEKDLIILDDELLYKLGKVILNDTYYHHSLPDDNLFLPKSYIDTLNEYRKYDPDRYRVARLGRFGVNGLRVLPQFVTAKHEKVMQYIEQNRGHIKEFCGMDFGFEESYNAVLRMAVDTKKKWLLIYWEYYKNKMTDDETALELESLKNVKIVADSAEPKAIAYYRKRGFNMRPCTKFAGSRLDNVRKIKRFKKIICSKDCPNTIKELQNLVYFVDNNGKMIYDKFNIDPHTFSAMWYGLDRYEVVDAKVRKHNSWKGYQEAV